MSCSSTIFTVSQPANETVTLTTVNSNWPSDGGGGVSKWVERAHLPPRPPPRRGGDKSLKMKIFITESTAQSLLTLLGRVGQLGGSCLA